MTRIALNGKRASKLEPVEIIPAGSYLKVSADPSNSGTVYLSQSKRDCHNRKKAMVLEPGSWATLNVSSSGVVFARGSKDGQVISFLTVDGIR